jgi:hypothetical protein
MTTATLTDHETIWRAADAAGRNAAESITPRAMIVEGMGRTYYVADGVCGFAWVNWKANTPWGRWTKATGRTRKDSYLGGQTLWVSDYGQSMARKEAYAEAFAKVLADHGIDAYAGSRMD